MASSSHSSFDTLATFVHEVARQNSDRVAVVWPKTKTTYSELDVRTARVASALEYYGLPKGSHIGAFMLNSPHMVYVWLGTLRSGLVFVPFNSALKGDLLNYQIVDSGIKILFIDSNLLELIPPDTPDEIKTIVVGKGPDSIDSFGDFCENGREECLPVKVAPSDPATVLYTSGTTGPPRGVVLPHYSFVNRVREVERIIDLRSDDVLYNVLPFFHTSGQVMTTLPALMNGATVVQDTWFHASRFWKYADETHATVGFVLMRMVDTLLQSENFVSNNLRVLMSGGVRKETLLDFENRFQIPLIEGFGMTETCGISIFNTGKERRVGSVGKPLPSVEVKLFDENKSSLGVSETGEIYLRPKIPHTFFTEYLNSQVEEAWTVDGWFKTGDLATMDEDGFYYYVERKKDIIRCREENISPSEIERVAESHHAVVESAAVGIEMIEGGEEILLAIKTREKLDPFELLSFLEERLPFYMVPRYLLYREELPKTANQKIRRCAIRDLGVANAVDATKIGFRARRPSEYGI